jgi:RHS repeat-associated protein
MNFISLLARLVAAIALGIFAHTLSAQSADPSQDILPPSPAAASFTKYVDFPVNTSTGTPSISIPIGAVSANKLSVPVSLSYHAGGVKVDEVAGTVGLGWNLNAGGVINRTVRDRYDEDPQGGYLQHTNDIPTPQISSQAEFDAMNSIAVGDWDGQPDLFQFSFGDYSGKFVFGANSVIQMIPKQDLRITYTTCTGVGCPGYATTGTIISFTVTTPDGVQYLFGTLTAIESSKTTNSTVSGGNCIPREYPNQTITAWYLKSVTNPRSGDVITLNYTDYTVSYDISYNESYKYAYSDNSTSAGGCPAVVPGTHAKCLTQKTDYGKLLSSIVSPLGKIEFTPEPIRSDVTVSAGNYRIKEAKIYGKNNVLLRSFQFTQTFIQSTGTTPSPAAASKYRMYLDGITESDAANVQVNNWVFDYHNRTSLPPRFSFQQDHWGYFNNRNNTQLTPAPTVFGTQYVDLLSNNFNPANRTPDGTVSYYGNLKKVTYPTGGSVDYEYEGNEVAVCANENVPTPATSSLALTYAGTPLTQTVDFTINYTQPVKITYDVQQNGVHLAGAYARLRQISPSASTLQTWGAQLASPVLLQGTKYFILSAGTYRLEVSVQQGALGAGYNAPFSNQPEHANITAEYSNNVSTYIYNKPTGGIRLKKSTTDDGATGTSAAIIKTYQYNKSAPNCTNASSAVYMGANPRYFSTEYSMISLASVGGPCDYAICKYYRLSSSSNVVLSNASGNIVVYREVWESQGLNAENGKKYFKHQEVQDVLPEQGANAYDPFLSTPYTDYSYKNGKMVEEKVLNAAGQTVSQKLYDYQLLETQNTTTTRGMVARKMFTPQCTFTYASNSSVALVPFAYEWYDIVSQFVYLRQTKERIYNSNGSGAYVESITDYSYDLPNMTHLMPVRTKVTNSDGIEYITQNTYPPQYNTTTVTDIAATAIKKLKDNFMIGQPIESLSIVKTSGVEYITGGSITKFKDFNGTTMVLPNETWGIATTTPVLSTSFTPAAITGGNFTQDSRYYHVNTLGAYDSKANLVELNKKDDQVSTIIYGEALSIPIAFVKNALSTEVAFTSFEEASGVNINGNWDLGANGGRTSVSAYTGDYGFLFNASQTIAKSSLPAGKYIVSFFYKDANISVNGTAVTSNANATWQYGETTVTMTGTNTLNVTGATNAMIDELRVYPADALMRSFSIADNSLYTLAATDENSVAIHYNYDNAQRLQFVRDQDKNIVQAYEYNYQQSNNGLNNIKSHSVLASGKTTLAQVTALTGADVSRVFQYMDGLGRTIQSNEIAQSPSQNDIISYQLYDGFGRATKGFMPYTITSNSGAYRTAAATEQTTFINGFGAGGFGYSETGFEASPINRVTAKAAPGATWNLSTANKMTYIYRGNTATEAIRDFNNNTSYADNTLVVTETTDENGKKSINYTDKLGRSVLSKQQLPATLSGTDATDYAYTYAIYDDFGRVIAVIPPETAKKMKAAGTWDYTSATYSSMVFRYQFDARGRLTTKTLPSAGSTTIAYDRLDRPVLVTDAKGFKNYTRYDILNRVVATGKYKGTAVPGTTEPLFETSNTTAPHFYTTTTFPTDNNVDVYQVMYYDDYDLDNNGSVAASEAYTNPAETPFDAAAFLRLRGMMTAVKSGILSNSGAAPATYLTARTYYDKEYSAIQVNKQNHLGGADIVSSAYDFANRVTKTRRNHTATPPGGTLTTHVINEEYVYDHASRLLYTVHQIGTQQKVVISGNKYDELGRMKEKNLHASTYTGTALPITTSTYNYLQSLDYTYNIRGWLTGINDPTPSTCATQLGDNLADMFNMKLSYESLTSGGTAQYNGNISVMEWRTNVGGVCGERQLYNFSYDGANRLTAADHRSWNGTAWINPNKYNESGITYDLNGNIKTYTRQGATTSPTTFGTIDNLTYTYGDALRPDRLTQVADIGSITKGFKYVAAAAAYTYDLNGNMTRDNHKTVSIAYNHLNLPNSFAFDSGSEITIVYSADGTKLSKTAGAITKNYVSGIEYTGATLEAIYHAEGRCTPNGASFNYDYTLKDHLGNTRVNFRANGTTTTHLEALHYYPFGMLMEGLGTTSPLNDYAYNGKELNEDFGLNLSDYGARWYDAALGRWWSVDPMAEAYAPISTYHYGMNNPILFIDPDGMSSIRSGTHYQLIRSEHTLSGRPPTPYQFGSALEQLRGMSAIDRNYDWPKGWDKLWETYKNRSEAEKSVPFYWWGIAWGMKYRKGSRNVGTIATNFALMGKTSDKNANSILSPETSSNTGSQNAVRHITLSALAYDQFFDAGVDAVLASHENNIIVDPNQRVFKTYNEADMAVDFLNNQLGKGIADNLPLIKTNKDVFKAVLNEAHNNGVWQGVRTGKNFTIKRVKLTNTQYSDFNKALENKNNYAEWEK